MLQYLAKWTKYSRILSSVVSGFSPPTKIFFMGSFFIAIAFFGSICRPSSLCSFCAKTCVKRNNDSAFHRRITRLQVSRSTKAYLFYTGWLFKKNKPKSPWSSSVGVHFDGAVCHLSKFREVIFKILFTSVPAEPTNKHFPEETKQKIRMRPGGGVVARISWIPPFLAFKTPTFY